MSAVTYRPADVERHTTRAREQGIRLGSTANAFVFRATSSANDGHSYTTRVTPGTGDTWAAECDCLSTGQCKHGAAAISAVQLRTVRDAAQILARHGARKRAAAKAKAA